MSQIEAVFFDCELLTCDSEADCDQNAVCWYLKRVEICHFVIGRHIATKTPPAWVSEWSRFASVRQRGISRPTEWQNATKRLNATPREILQHDKAAFAAAR